MPLLQYGAVGIRKYENIYDCWFVDDSAEGSSNYEDEETPERRSNVLEMQPSSSYDEPRQTLTSAFPDGSMLTSA